MIFAFCIFLDRKQYQLEIPLKQDVQMAVTNGFERYQFIHQALPEINFDEIDTSTSFCGKRLKAPILISSMTGGEREGGEYNRRFAQAAESAGIAMAVGSERVLIEVDRRYRRERGGRLRFEEVLASFAVRKFANPPLFFGNLGAIQLNNGMFFDDIKRAVKLINADGIFLHLNPLQEAIQENGNTNFKNLINKIEEIMSLADFPVIIKEVGSGISQEVSQKLKKAGVKIIDVAGAGGTSWSAIEAAQRSGMGEREKVKGKKEREDIRVNPLEIRENQVIDRKDNLWQSRDEIDYDHVGDMFRNWGISTAESLVQMKEVKGLQMIASGGIRNGIEIAKALALGAELVGIGMPFLMAAKKSPKEIARHLQTVIYELKLAMFCVGVRTIGDLKKVKLIRVP